MRRLHPTDGETASGARPALRLVTAEPQKIDPARLEYVADMIGQLGSMARTGGYARLADLLEEARAEAERARQG